MVKFIVLLEKSSISVQKELMVRHIDHLKNLKRKGLLFLCGPFKNDNGVIQILMARNREDAEKYILEDPFTTEGVFAKYTIHELIEATEENNYLLRD